MNNDDERDLEEERFNAALLRASEVLDEAEGLAACDNCGKIEHTPEELRECVVSMLAPDPLEDEEILQVSWELDEHFAEHQEALEIVLSLFGLRPGDTGAGFGRRDMEFHLTRKLTDPEEEFLEQQLRTISMTRIIPGFAYSWYNMTEDFEPDDHDDDPELAGEPPVDLDHD